MNDKNIFAYQENEEDPGASYMFDFEVLLDYFTTYLTFHISDDPFPKNTIANNARDMMDEVALVEGDDSDLSKWTEVDWNSVDMDLEKKINLWSCHHGLLTHREGTFLPDCFFRRVNNKVEISWKNKFPHVGRSGEWYFQHKEGVEYIDLKLYKETIMAFCNDVLEKFKDRYKYPVHIQRYRDNLKKIDELWMSLAT